MTPTPTIKTIILSDGTRLEDRGEVRQAQKGDWYLGAGGVFCWPHARSTDARFTILSPVEAPAGNLERRGNWMLWTYVDGVDRCAGREATHALIDAACAVVNYDKENYNELRVEYEPIHTGLANALRPFTQAVKEERFFTKDKDCCVWERCESGGAKQIFVCESPGEAKVAAAKLNAMKNSQSEGGE